MIKDLFINDLAKKNQISKNVDVFVITIKDCVILIKLLLCNYQ